MRRRVVIMGRRKNMGLEPRRRFNAGREGRDVDMLL